MKRPTVAARRPGGLVRFWLAAALIAAGLYGLGVLIPAARDLLIPGYGIIAGFVLFFTVRWYRPRRGERRRADRRDQ